MGEVHRGQIDGMECSRKMMGEGERVRDGRQVLGWSSSGVRVLSVWKHVRELVPMRNWMAVAMSLMRGGLVNRI